MSTTAKVGAILIAGAFAFWIGVKLAEWVLS